MHVVTYLAQKGGVGKSTLSTQMAVYASTLGEVVALLDIDPQGSAFLWKTKRKANVPIVLRAAPDKLQQMVAKAVEMGVSLMMIDTPPHSDKTAIEAIRVADLIVCPTKSDLYTLGALADTMRLLDLAESKSKAIAVINDLPSKGRQNAIDTALAALNEHKVRIAETLVDNHQPIVDAIRNGEGITESSPRSAAARQIKALWNEINQLWPVVASRTTKTEVQS